MGSQVSFLLGCLTIQKHFVSASLVLPFSPLKGYTGYLEHFMAVSWPMVSSCFYWVGLGTETVGSGDKRIMLAVVSVPEVDIALHNCTNKK